MPGLTQSDVTPKVLEEEEKEEEKGYDWGRWLTKPGNEIEFLWNSALETSRRLRPKGERTARVGLLKLRTTGEERDPGYGGIEPDGIFRPTLSRTQRQAAVGVIEPVIVDPAIEVTSAVQQGVENAVAPLQGRPAEQTDIGDWAIGRGLLEAKENLADVFGAKQRYELDPEDRWTRDLPSSVTSAAITAFLLSRVGLTPGANSTAFTGMRFNPFSAAGSMGPRSLTQVGGPWGAYWRANPQWAQAATRWLAFGGLESFGTTFISNQTEFGYGEPGDSNFTSTMKSLIPNAGEDLATGFLVGLPLKGLDLGGKGLGQLFTRFIAGESNIARSQRGAQSVADVKAARDWTEANGIQQQNPDGTYEFTAENPWTTEPVTNAQVEADIMAAQALQEPPKTPRAALDQLTAEPLPEFWEGTVPEVDTLKRALDDLDDVDLVALEQDIAGGLSTMEAVGARLETQSQRIGDVDNIVMGPPRAGIDPGRMAELEALSYAQLQAVARSDVFVQRELARMGVQPTQATKTQIIQAVLARQTDQGLRTPTQVDPNALSPKQRNDLQAKIVGQAVSKGEVRPSATPVPDVPNSPKKKAGTATAAEIIDEELRLQGEYQKAENAKREVATRAEREATGYYDKTETEQAAAGKYEGWDKPVDKTQSFEDYRINPDDSVVGDTGLTAAQISRLDAITPEETARLQKQVLSDRQVANRQKKLAAMEAQNQRQAEWMDDDTKLRNGEMSVEDYEAKYGVGAATAEDPPVFAAKDADVKKVRRELRNNELARRSLRYLEQKTPDTPTDFKFPPGYEKSNPMYGRAELAFESDLDRAAYMLQSKQKSQKALRTKQVIRESLREQGWDPDNIAEYGKEVKGVIQDVIKQQTGSTRAPQEPMRLEIPDPRMDPEFNDTLMSVEEPELPEFSSKKVGAEDQANIAIFYKQSKQRLENELNAIAERIFGKDNLPERRYSVFKEEQILPPEWGGDGVQKTNPAGSYDLVNDVIVINELMTRDPEQVKSTMFHEAWHRIQGGLMTPAQRRVMDAAFGRQDLEFFSQIDFGGKVQPIEIQARAFQNFGTMMDSGLDRVDIRYRMMMAKLDEQFPGLSGKRGGWAKKITAKMYQKIDQAFYGIYQFAVRSKNYIDGNGFQSVYDIFKEAYDGRMAANQKYENWYKVYQEKVIGFTDTEFNALEGKAWDEYAEQVENMVDRQYFWEKWSGEANKAMKAIDTRINSLKQRALQEGC